VKKPENFKPPRQKASPVVHPIKMEGIPEGISAGFSMSEITEGSRFVFRFTFIIDYSLYHYSWDTTRTEYRNNLETQVRELVEKLGATEHKDWIISGKRNRSFSLLFMESGKSTAAMLKLML